jgi:hypothetical protein
MLIKWRSPLVGLVSFLLFFLIGIWFYYQYSDYSGLRWLPGVESNGEITLEAPETISVNRPFTMNIVIDSMGNDVNAVGLYMRFDPQALELVNMDTSQSFCQFYPEKRFDNNLGTVSLACGSPHPGIKGESTLVKLEFLPTKLGTSQVYILPESELLKSDGQGTNILTEYPSYDVSVINTL